MRALTAFIQKEALEIIRSGKGLLLVLIFILFGIMNPAIAKLTPWMMETMADSLKDTGLAVKAVEVNAMTSWTQFYKNAPMAMIIFVLLFGGIFTREYQKNTLVIMVTKGLSRWKIVVSKMSVLIIMWTVCYWMMFGITYGYNLYFWDNNGVRHILFSAFCLYMTGIWLISLLILGSAFLNSGGAVLGIVGGGVFLCYLLSLLPDCSKYLPTYLLNSQILLTGSESCCEFLPAVVMIIILSICFTVVAVVTFNKKAL